MLISRCDRLEDTLMKSEQGLSIVIGEGHRYQRLVLRLTLRILPCLSEDNSLRLDDLAEYAVLCMFGSLG